MSRTFYIQMWDNGTLDVVMQYHVQNVMMSAYTLVAAVLRDMILTSDRVTVRGNYRDGAVVRVRSPT